MKECVFVKRIDELGRVVIPRDIRKALNVNKCEEVRFVLSDDGVTLKKATEACALCGSEESLTEIKGRFICQNCVNELTQR